jgi:hypothetical protein
MCEREFVKWKQSRCQCGISVASCKYCKIFLKKITNTDLKLYNSVVQEYCSELPKLIQNDKHLLRCIFGDIENQLLYKSKFKQRVDDTEKFTLIIKNDPDLYFKD